MITYNPRAARALGFLKSTYNDIEIYVEDTASQNMWLRILRAILPKNIRINSVNMLGGRDAVERACRLDQKVDGRKRLYIVDGDMDFLLGKAPKRLKYFYRIKGYCVENILLRRDAVVEVAMDHADAIIPVDGQLEIFEKYEQELKHVFSLYAAAQYLRVRQKTVSHNVMNLLDGGSGDISISLRKIRNRRREVWSSILRTTKLNDARDLVEDIRNRAERLPLAQCVSGKDYLLPLVWLFVRRVFGYKGSQNDFKTRLAKEFQPSFEPFLARRLLVAAKPYAMSMQPVA